LMKAEIEEEEAKISAARNARNAANTHSTHVEENKKENEDNQKMLLKQFKKNELLIKRIMDPQSLVAKNDRLTQQVLEGQELEKRYRSERNAALAENVKLKKSNGDKDRKIAALEKSNEDKDRKIAALERQLAAASTS